VVRPQAVGPPTGGHSLGTRPPRRLLRRAEALASCAIECETLATARWARMGAGIALLACCLHGIALCRSHGPAWALASRCSRAVRMAVRSAARSVRISSHNGFSPRARTLLCSLLVARVHARCARSLVRASGSSILLARSCTIHQGRMIEMAYPSIQRSSPATTSQRAASKTRHSPAAARALRASVQQHSPGSSSKIAARRHAARPRPCEQRNRHSSCAQKRVGKEK
jgi:hypothetical protein